MNWEYLTEESQLDELTEKSSKNPILIFKHSTSCSISHTALNRLERNWDLENENDSRAFLLDLLRHRNISNEIAQRFDVYHQSPQVLVIANGKAIYDASHFDINYKDIKNHLQLVEG